MGYRSCQGIHKPSLLRKNQHKPAQNMHLQSAAREYSSSATSDSAALSSSAWPTMPATASVWMGCSANSAAASAASAR